MKNLIDRFGETLTVGSEVTVLTPNPKRKNSYWSDFGTVSTIEDDNTIVVRTHKGSIKRSTSELVHVR